MKVLNPPKEIWLCVGEVDDGADFNDLATEEIGWCTDQMDEADVRYVLAPEAGKWPLESIVRREMKLMRSWAEGNQASAATRERTPEETRERAAATARYLLTMLEDAGLEGPGAEEEDSLRERSHLFQKPAER